MIYSLRSLKTSSVYFPLWLFIGVVIYAIYGYAAKRFEEKKRAKFSVQKVVEKV